MVLDRNAYLNDTERAEILRIRGEKGFPLHSPPHPFRLAGTYAVTVATYQHAHLINSSERRTYFELRLLDAFLGSGADVLGWVVLTNHYHLLVNVQSLEDVSSVLKQIHGRTSREWNIEDQKVGNRRVWYKFYDRMIRNERHFLKALNYIHYNPVKHQYVEDSYGWPWSSIHLYYENKGREWLRVQWKHYKPGKEMAGEFQE